MDYAEAVEGAPAGWTHFTWADVERLPHAVFSHELARVPAHERRLIDRGEPSALERFTRATFWTLVYHLEADRWDELARAEPIHPRLLQALPQHRGLSLDVGAGSGRLTQVLIRRSEHVIAIEPSLPLGSILARRLPSAGVVSAWAENLPLPARCADLTAACGALGPDPAVLEELNRVTKYGGCIAMISPEKPEWFEAQGWSRVAVDPIAPRRRAAWIEEFFGPLDPPHVMFMTTAR